MEQINKATFAAISCVHVPFENKTAKEQMLSNLSSNAPTHFILLGDLFDAGEVSVHPSEFEHALEDEYEAGHKYLSDIMSVLPDTTKLVWIHGVALEDSGLCYRGISTMNLESCSVSGSRFPIQNLRKGCIS